MGKKSLIRDGKQFGTCDKEKNHSTYVRWGALNDIVFKSYLGKNIVFFLLIFCFHS